MLSKIKKIGSTNLIGIVIFTFGILPLIIAISIKVLTTKNIIF